MTTRKPIVNASGTLSELSAGDDIDSSLIFLPKTGTVAGGVSAQRDFTTRGSSGVIDGTLTYVTVGSSSLKISVAAGEGYIRTTNDQQGDLTFCAWPTAADLYTFSAPAAGQESVIFIGIEYSGGSVAAVAKTAFTDWNWYTNFSLARCSYDGTTMRILNAYAHAEDTANLTRKYLRLTMPFTREQAPEGSGGLEVSSNGSRQLAMTAGNVWHGYNRYVLSAVTAGTAFDGHYRRAGGGFTNVVGATVWPNTQYDDGSGTLATLGASKYGCIWVYLDIADGSLDFMYGRGEYTSVGNAQAEAAPTIPNHLTYHGKLVARIIFQKSGVASLVESAWAQTFGASAVGDHALLTNLQGGTGGEYYHATSAEYTGTGTGVLVRKDSPTITGTASAVELKGNGMFQKQSVSAGETLTIPAGYSLSVANGFTVDGTLVVNGDLEIR